MRATLTDLSSSPRLSGSGIGPVNICKFLATPPPPRSASCEDLADLDSYSIVDWPKSPGLWSWELPLPHTVLAGSMELISTQLRGSEQECKGESRGKPARKGFETLGMTLLL